jgi:cytochrome oxidase Cu insertion factor (SCO1/SenC/PrrC family)
MQVDGWKGKTYSVDITGDSERDASFALDVRYQIAGDRSWPSSGVADRTGFHVTIRSTAGSRSSQPRGKVVAVDFMYATCQLPDFCVRIVNRPGRR